MEINRDENMRLIEERKIRCQRCGKEIGVIVEVEQQEWLLVSGVLVTVMRGVCECGEEFHWSISERTLARLINRVKKC